jgi:ABC-type molybdenum transport system ATPase subunit/photorepair protein PhrA
MILDEPCQGLSAESRSGLLAILSEMAEAGISTIINIAHCAEENIPGTQNELELCPGATPMYRIRRLSGQPLL